ncbi:NADH-quinone oxidoreductase subunit C [candidate division KSB1 bacterium]
MTAEEIYKRLSEKFGEKILETDIEALEPAATVDAAAIAEVCEFLRDDPELKFGSLMCLSSVDHDEENLRVIYHLDSIEKKHKATLQVIAPKSDPKVPTVSNLWHTADWHEREAFDLMGVTFKGHPDPRRILLPDDWEGHPLRKDYVTPQEYNGLKVPYPGEENNGE